MWIKLDNQLLSCAPMRKLSLPLYNGDSQGNTRLMIALKIFVESANGCAWFDSHDLSKWIGITGKSIDIVWQFLVSSGILISDIEGRYSAIKWLSDNRYFGDTRNRQNEDRTVF